MLDWVRRKITGHSLALKNKVARFEGKAHFVGKLGAMHNVPFPSRAVMVSKYFAPAGSWRIFGYEPIRFKHLWGRYSQTMWQLLRRDQTFITEARLLARFGEYLGWH